VIRKTAGQMKLIADKPIRPGARLWPQTRPKCVGLFARAAVGSSHTAAIRSLIPTGLDHSAQGWPRQRTTLGQRRTNFINPERVASNGHRKQSVIQPLQGCDLFNREPRVARSAQPWAERFDPFGIGRRTIPTGLYHSAQGCRACEATLGGRIQNVINPERVASTIP
jgi:hypothetical protein